MVERAEREPTMEEIVAALRETRRRAGRNPSLTVVGRGAGGEGGAAPDTRPEAAGSIAIGDLRDEEIRRLLTENAGLNERILHLLKIIECEQANRAPAADAATDRAAIVRDVTAALEAGLRPMLMLVLRVLEREHGHAAGGAADHAARPDAQWIVDLEQETRP
jgi:hypothetical protein